METGSDNGNDWRQDLASVSDAMPYEPDQPRFGASARSSVRLFVSMVAAVGSGFRAGRADSCASRRILDRARGASALPI
jgi:hypothetical protein